MRNRYNQQIIVVLFFLLGCLTYVNAAISKGESVYKQKPNDSEAIYFTPENFGIKADGKTDVSDALQQALNQVKREANFGIVFLPEGTYKISKTIYIPQAVRLIGYGRNRPVIVLGKNTPGYQQEVADDKGKANYMFWFTGSIVEPGQPIRDAGAGTFYSAISNVDLKIEDGNPYAVALRTHFAQHSFVSNVDIHIGKGKAGLFDVGNEMENVRFFGGDYGIYTTKTSPAWEMMMVNTYFEGQRKAAVRTQEGGLTIVRLYANNVPVVIDIDPNYGDKIYMEDCVFENIKQAAVIVSNENNQANQLSLLNISCRNVPVLAHYRKSGKETRGEAPIYRVKRYTHGLHMEDMAAEPEMRTVADMEILKTMPALPVNDIRPLPPVETWVNIRDLGAKGDGETDDTEVFLRAIAEYEHIYLPQGWYVISESLVLKPNTNLIGLNPIATQLILKESTPAFSGFGAPKPLLETPKGGTNIVNGVGLNTGAYNYRAVGCKWMAGASSYMNDVKFVGGHGTMRRPQPGQQSNQGGRRTPQISSPFNPVTEQGKDRAWDTQYWSLWITNGGGGVFKDIWTASSYSSNGIYVSDTSTEGKIYAMSVEHHVRNEARFKRVSNWKLYAFQFEIETREGPDCLELELDECSNMLFANLYLFRVIRLVTPFPYAVRTWNCKNIEFFNAHNFGQMRFVIDLTVYDINTEQDVRPWEFTYLKITGNEPRKTPLAATSGKVERLGTGFEFAEGAARDSKGNVYFSEQRMRRIYKWDVQTEKLSLLADYPWQPLSLAFDTQDNLLVVFRYDPQPGYLVDGKQETVPRLPDAEGTNFSKWGNSGFATWVYSVDPDRPDETIRLLPKVKMGSVQRVAKALYPSNRWRDMHDFDEVSLYVPEECFVAPDGVTIIPEHYDLARSSSVIEAIPGKPLYSSDEYERRIVRLDVAPNGTLSNLRHFIEQGEFGTTVDKNGHIYVTDGHVYVFDKEGKQIRRIVVPERPSSLTIGGKHGDELFITARSSIYRVKID
ncbi:glycosyl hydrolase family 28-related protein [Parabacteroides sp. PF5-9]|uniref:glycosyl hydrolase family 28-related protein n=1 Tax=Parabacteroides sp. PF5-9 TaxID=1742404 RepID=UPI002476CB4C|nr:glycosyl hydrolase family 28-related protein [Parabacteroides sp. PF5-9]MDH6357676.1 sugar lactone lactonase YvrE [Parabacteroides sp. PF5-9]